MRLLRVLLAIGVTILALTVGVFAAAIALVAAIGFFLGRMLLRRIGSKPRPTVSGHHATPARARADGDVIEVTATEVRSDPTLR